MTFIQVIMLLIVLALMIRWVKRRRARRDLRPAPPASRPTLTTKPPAARTAATRPPRRTATSAGLMIVDTETTGLSNDARVIELAWIVVDADLRELTKGSSLLRGDGTSGGPSARAVHGISDRDLRHAPVFMDVWRTLDDHRVGRQLVAHNAAFDRRMINSELRRVGAPNIAWMGCTMQLARQLGYGGGKGAGGRSVALGALVSRLGLDVNPTHRALADAEAALALLRYFQRRHPTEVASLLVGGR